MHSTHPGVCSAESHMGLLRQAYVAVGVTAQGSNLGISVWEGHRGQWDAQ